MEVPFGNSLSLPDSDDVNIRKDIVTPNVVGGTVDIKTITLTMNNGSTINLKGFYETMVIEESMFSSSISGKLTILDTEGGLEKFVIHGGETLSMKICKHDNGDIIIWREDLIVHKVTRNEVNSQNLMSRFDIIFTSRSHINSLKKNLFQSFKNTTIAEAVKTIYSEMSGNDIVVEDPKVTLKTPFISTGVSPHKAIDYLAQRACSRNKYFVFFERFVPVYGSYSDGKPFTTSHYFGSVEKLIKDASTGKTQTIYFIPKLNANKETSLIRASRYERLDNFNHIPGMMLGFYNTTISSINPITRKYETSKLSYTDSDVEETDFYTNKLFGTTNVFNNYDDVKNETPGRKLIMSGINDSVGREFWLGNHIYGTLSKTMFKISVEIQGGTNNIGVGHVVNFVAPSQVSVNLNPQSPFPEIDPIYSGKYLVTSVLHSLSSTQYVKSLQLSRGSSPLNFDTNTLLDSTFDDIKQEIRESLGNRRLS